MGLERFAFKLFARNPESVELHDFVPVFHRFIQTRRLPGLWIDVADYAHVPDGPGVVLIGHEADCFVDRSEGPLGLLYNRKRRAQGSTAERLARGLAECLVACAALEDEPDLRAKGLAFDGSRLRFIANDRNAAPNDDRTLDALRPDLVGLLERVYPGETFELTRLGPDPRSRLTVEVQAAAAPSLSGLRQRLAV
jgi:hypothetical protein